MIRFFTALTIAIFFYARMDILIWQRIFEANNLHDLGIGVYHWGWLHALFGFMLLGLVLFHPHRRRMLTFPLSLYILAYSGIEDVLYYWLDGKSIPAELPWLNNNPLLIRPVTNSSLLISAGVWLLVIVLLEWAGAYLEERRKAKADKPAAGQSAVAQPAAVQTPPFEPVLGGEGD